MHLGQVISTHPKELLTKDESFNYVLRFIGTSCNAYEVRKYYEERPDQLKADVPYILGMLVNYSEIYQKTKIRHLEEFLFELILPFCNKSQLNKCLRVYFSTDKRLPRIFIDKKVALTPKQAQTLVLQRKAASEIYPWLNVQKNSIFENVKLANTYLTTLANEEWMDANPEHVFISVKTLHTAEGIKVENSIHVFAKKLFEYHNHSAGLAYVSSLITAEPSKEKITETDLTTISLTARKKVLSALSTKSYAIDIDTLSDAAKQRLTLLSCQAMLSRATGMPAVGDVLFQLLDHDLTKVKELHSMCYPQLSPEDQEPNKEKKELTLASSQSVYQYLIQKYLPIVKKTLGWDIQYFESQYPSVYSLVPFMSPLVKAGAWIAKELEIDNAEIVYFLERYTQLYTDNYDHSTAVNDKRLATLLSGAKLKSLTENAAYLLAFLSYNIDLRESSVPFSSVKLKDFLTLIYGSVEIKKVGKSKALYLDINLDHYKDDPLPMSVYLDMLKSGMLFSEVQIMNNMRNKLGSQYRISMLTMNALPTCSEGIKLNNMSWWKLICKTKEGALRGDWLEHMQKALKLKQAPDSVEQLIDMYVKTDSTFQKIMLGSALKNRYAILARVDEVLPKIPDLIQELNQLGSYKAKEFSNLPDIHLPINEEYEAFILPPGDQRALIVGTLTGCCQHISGAAKSIAISSYTDPDQGVFVVAAKTGRIIAQSFIWHGDINRPEKVKGKFKPENFNGKLLAIDSIEYRRFDEAMSYLEQVIAKGYYLFMQEMAKHGYAVGLNPDENTESNRVLSLINQMENISTSDYLAPMTNAISAYQKKLGYTDLNMSECHGFIVRN